MPGGFDLLTLLPTALSSLQALESDPKLEAQVSVAMPAGFGLTHTEYGTHSQY